MPIRFGLLVAGGAAAAFLSAPAALAQPNCVVTGPEDSTTQCQSPGNVQINDTPPLEQEPFIMPYWDGVYGGPYPVPFDEGSHL